VTEAMVARLQRLMLATGALVTAILVLWVGARHEPAVAASMLLVPALLHLSIFAVEFLWMYGVNRRARAGALRAPAATLVRAWISESLHAVKVFLWRQPFRSNAWPDWLPSDAAGVRGMLLVHGYACNRGVWNHWFPKLQKLDIPHVAVNLEPVLGNIEQYSQVLDAAPTTGGCP
jgi:triacylglycerol lipase